MKIKIKLIRDWCKIEVSKKGEWIDLRSAKTTMIKAPTVSKNDKTVIFDSSLIPLGIAMELPKHFEANIVPRSSTYSNFGVILSNSMGIIDSAYKGDNDEWKMNVIALRNSVIQQGERIAQFRIRPSQFAPWWVKIKWLFVNKIEFKSVKTLGNKSRGGFGSTGTK